MIRQAQTPGSTSNMGNCQKIVNLALQGGGSHGAFAWGVLDRLLEEERVSFEGITATSAGAVNAVVLADGFAAGGREGAREHLKKFWMRTSEKASQSVFAPSFLDETNPAFGLDHSPGYVLINALSRVLSPYQLNPLDINPLRELLNEIVDFRRVREQKLIKLFICATGVRTSRIKIFKNMELTADHILASACLPFIMRAPEIDGEPYWDGGFLGNPAIFPVIYECEARDVIVVHLTPMFRPDRPSDAAAIINRMQEISFNSSLMREMRVIAILTKLIDEGKFDAKRMFMHLIEAEDVIRDLAGSSKMNGTWKFLLHLFEIGRQQADKWLSNHFDNLGLASTVDLEKRFL